MVVVREGDVRHLLGKESEVRGCGHERAERAERTERIKGEDLRDTGDSARGERRGERQGCSFIGRIKVSTRTQTQERERRTFPFRRHVFYSILL